MRQEDIVKWSVATFGAHTLKYDERSSRFIEEAIELAHAAGLPMERIVMLLARVYAREQGRVRKELGQVGLTLEALAETFRFSLEACTAEEWNRVQAISKEEWQRRHAAKVAAGIAS